MRWHFHTRHGALKKGVRCHLAQTLQFQLNLKYKTCEEYLVNILKENERNKASESIEWSPYAP